MNQTLLNAAVATAAPVVPPRCTKCGHACPGNRACAECGEDYAMAEKDTLCAHCAREEAAKATPELAALAQQVASIDARVDGQAVRLTTLEAEVPEVGLVLTRCATVEAKCEALSKAVEKLTLEREPGGAAEVDYAKVAAEVDLAGLAAELAGAVSLRELAENIDASDLAGEVSVADVASELDLSDLAEHLDLSEVAGHLDLNDLVRDTVAEELQDKVSELRRELLEELKAMFAAEVTPLSQLRITRV